MWPATRVAYLSPDHCGQEVDYSLMLHGKSLPPAQLRAPSLTARVGCLQVLGQVAPQVVVGCSTPLTVFQPFTQPSSCMSSHPRETTPSSPFHAMGVGEWVVQKGHESRSGDQLCSPGGILHPWGHSGGQGQASGRFSGHRHAHKNTVASRAAICHLGPGPSLPRGRGQLVASWNPCPLCLVSPGLVGHSPLAPS